MRIFRYRIAFPRFIVGNEKVSREWHEALEEVIAKKEKGKEDDYDNRKVPSRT